MVLAPAMHQNGSIMRLSLLAYLTLSLACTGGSGPSPSTDGGTADAAEQEELLARCRGYEEAHTTAIASMGSLCQTDRDCITVGGAIDGFGLPSCNCHITITGDCGQSYSKQEYVGSQAATLASSYYEECTSVAELGRLCDCFYEQAKCNQQTNTCYLPQEENCFGI